MAETRQKFIEISDCDYLVFQESLRFLYCNEARPDLDLVLKLFVLADKFVQDDLSKRCLQFLQNNTNTDNVYAILDFAREENIDHLRS